MNIPAPDIGKSDPMPAIGRGAILAPVAANMAFVLELTLVPMLLPAMQLQFGLSNGDLAWIFNAYGIAVAVGVLLGGWFGDAFETRKVFCYGVVFFAAGSLLVASAESFETLMVGRVIQGFGAGTFAPLVPIILTQSSPHKPGRVLIVWGSIAGYVVAFAPFFYGHFLGGNGWELGFVVTAILAASALLFMGRSQTGDDRGPIAVKTRRYATLLWNRNLWTTYGYVFCTYGCITYYLFRLPVWLSEYDVSATSLGLIFSILWLTFSGISTVLRNKVDGPHIQTIMVAAPFLIVGGLPLSYFVESQLLLVLSAICVGAGLACSNAPSTQMILKFAPKGLNAISASLDITFARLGGIATVAILADSRFVWATTSTAVLCVLAAFCAVSVTMTLDEKT